jgi:hypothetical protein
MRFFNTLIGSKGGEAARGKLSKRVRERRAERAAREAEAGEGEFEDPLKGQRICAFSGQPMAATDLQLEVEEQQARQRRQRKAIYRH